MKYSTTIILISLVITILIGIILLVPTLSNFIKVKTNIASADAKLETQTEYLAQLKATEKQLDQNAELVAKIENALPQGPDVASLLEFLDGSAKRNGINLEQVNWMDKSKSSEERVVDYVMSIGFSGSYYAFRNFISDVEKSSRIIDIDQITFGSAKESGLPIDFKLYLRIHSYKHGNTVSE